MTYLAAFYALLYRYSHQEDLTVGTPVANRGRAEADDLIGYFLNTIVLRADLSGAQSFAGLLAHVKDIALGAYAHQDAPFERVVEALRVPRDQARSPLFQAMFVHQRENEPMMLPGLATEWIPLGNDTAKFELTLRISEGTEGVACALEFSTDLFDVATIEQMLGHFQTLLEGVVVDPAQRIDALPLLTTAERRQLLVEWNQTTKSFPLEQCVHDLVEAQADRTPDAVAVVLGQEAVTYAQLDRRANQLAHHLRALGATCRWIRVIRSTAFATW
jgi:non-ribosomal peptide synthetase component F